MSSEITVLPVFISSTWLDLRPEHEAAERAKAIAYVEAALEIYEQIESPYAEKARSVLARWLGEA
jgi:hypothetical protein